MNTTPLTTKGLIDILPFEEAFRTDLKNKWDSLSIDQRNEIAQMLWNTYADIYQARYDANVDVELMEIAAGKKTGINKEFAKHIREKTQKELQTHVVSAVSTATLTDTRKALETLINTSSNDNN